MWLSGSLRARQLLGCQFTPVPLAQLAGQRVLGGVHVDAAGIELPEPVVPEPEIDPDSQPEPLCDSRWSFAEQTRRLLDAKRYIEGVTGPEHPVHAGRGALLFPQVARPYEGSHAAFVNVALRGSQRPGIAGQRRSA